MNFSKKIGTIAMTMMLLPSSVHAIDGETLPDPGSVEYNTQLELFETLEAVAGFGRTRNLTGQNGDLQNPTDQEHNTFCSGVLVAPNIVLTAAHCVGYRPSNVNDHFVDFDNDTWMQDYDLQGNMIPKFTVRFRLNPNGEVGTLDGTFEDFFQVPVKRIVFPSRVETSPGVWEDEVDTMLLILSDGPNDSGFWENGWIDPVNHIEPAPIAPVLPTNGAFLTGTSAAYGPIPDPNYKGFGNPGIPGTRGILRSVTRDPIYFTQSSMACDTRLTQFPLGVAATGDSGGVTFILTETGQYILASGIDGGSKESSCLPTTATWNHLFGGNPVYGFPELLLASQYDLTGSATPQSIGYGVSDWRIDMNDVLAMASSNLPAVLADWDDSGTVDSADFTDYALELATTANPYSTTSIFPMDLGISDANGDGRFNWKDYDSVLALNGSIATEDLIYDFSGNGVIDQADFDTLIRVLTVSMPLSVHTIFNQGDAGDVNQDTLVNCSDLDSVVQSGLLFDGSISFGDAGYDLGLDYNLNRMLDGDDHRRFAAQLLPGDVSTGYSLDPTGDLVFEQTRINPDSQLTTYDARMYLYRGVKDYPDPNFSVPISTDVVGNEWVEGGDYIAQDGIVTVTDFQYTLGSWMNPCNGTVITDGLLDLWFMDFNGDGRMNMLDVRAFQSVITADPLYYTPEFDFAFTQPGEVPVLNSLDVRAFFDIAHISSPFGQGILGDYNGDASPSCNSPIDCPPRPGSFNFDFCQDIVNNPCGEPITVQQANCQDLALIVADSLVFESGYAFGDEEFKVQLDADLDGDLDLDDKVTIFMHLQPGDLDLDGDIDSLDGSLFIERFVLAMDSNAGDPEFDPTIDLNQDGAINFFDYSAFNQYSVAPLCP